MLKYITVLFLVLNVIKCDFDLLILHNNDIHGRFEETERNSGTCQPNHKNLSCVGGFARTAHVIRQHRKEAEENRGPNVLYLNAGDTFIGTVWYTIHTWNISAAFMNVLRPDVQSLGNHEFDKGTPELARYISAVNFPVIGGNVDFSKVPELNNKIPKSVVLNVNGTKIGVIGHVTTETQKISSPGNTIFYDEVESVREESERLDNEGVKIIIVLGHSGYLKDQELAMNVPLADVVVGGHTNTFLWNGPQPDSEPVEDPYPKVVVQPSGKKVPVVQAYAYTKYLGRLFVTFDNNGNVISFNGDPVYLNSSIHQDEDVINLLNTYQPAVDEINGKIEGKLQVVLDGDQYRCRHEECNFGNLIADAMVMYKAKMSAMTWSEAPIGLLNGGGVRATVMPGVNNNVSRGELLAAQPFGNQLMSLSLKGVDLWKTLELGIRGNGETSDGEFLQVSGLKVVYDRSKPAMSRVVSVKTRCGACSVPFYEDLDFEKNYSIVLQNFLADGYDGHYIMKYNSFNRKMEDLSDIDVLAWYFNTYSPVYAEVQGRIRFVERDNAGVSSSGRNGWSNIFVFVVLVTVFYNVGV